MAPGAYGKADRACVVFIEIEHALIEIDIPLISAAHFLFGIVDRIDGTIARANLTIETEIIGPERIGRVRRQQHIGQHDARRNDAPKSR